MSYILDALKKSDSERQASAIADAVPGATYMVAPGRRAGNYGALLLAGAGMLVTGLAVGALRPWQALPPVAAGQDVASVAVPQPTAAAQPVATVPTVAAAQPVAPSRPVPAAAMAKIAAASSTPAKPAAAVPAAKAVAKTPPPKPAVADAPAKPRPPVKLAAREPEAAPAAARPSSEVVAFQELPAEIRESLPKVSFGGFAGGDQAGERIAFINNRLLKEGEEVSPGVRLERVGSDGVVLGYKGHYFRPGP